LSEYELAEGDEERLIGNIAKAVVDYGLEAPAILFLEAAKPLSFIASQLAIVLLAPIQGFFPFEGPKYTGLFMKRENVGKIIERIEELSKSKSSGS
jgi:hypothetical protein